MEEKPVSDTHAMGRSEPQTAPPTNSTDNVTGIKLVMMIVSLTLACFLILLDTSIVATVSTSKYQSSVYVCRLTSLLGHS